ncbi:MAG: nucleoside hydrolase [Phycisphaerales bacterium]|nr:MAG: nucleoside hydrolase [Phycisphaerales bacterium]
MARHNRLCTKLTRPVWLLAAVLIVARAAGAAPRPVILDTDICDDIDDTWALALLVQSPELDCKLVTTAVGNTEAKAKVVAKYLDKVGHAQIPVGIGIKQRDGGHRHTDWAEDYDLSSYPGGVYKDGVSALIDVVMKSPQRMTIIAVGPLPNIAAALEREPRIAEKADFIGMHGSIYKGYGGKSTPDAEYNVKADAAACRKVFTAAWPITITPLDTCGLVVLRGDKYQKVFTRNSAITDYLLENYRLWQANGLRGQDKDIDEADLQRRVDDIVKHRSSTLFDTVAVYLAISHGFTKMERLPVAITDAGHTKVTEGAKVIDCAIDWNTLGGFEDFLVERLTK